MAQVDPDGYKAQSAVLFPDNTNEDIAPIDMRAQDTNLADSVAFLNDTPTITGVWQFNSLFTIPLTPTADAHPVSKKYFDNNAGVGAGDVTGPGSSIDNNIVVFDGVTGKKIKNGTGVSLSQTGDFESVGNIGFSTATKTIAGIQNGNLLDKTASQTVSGGWTFSQSITTIYPTLDAHAATKKYVDDNIGGGDVFKVGTPVNNQLGVWTGDGTIEGDSNLTWDGSTLSVGGTLSLNSLTVDNIILDGNDISTSSGDLTFTPSGDFAVESGNATFAGDEITIGGGPISGLSGNFLTFQKDNTVDGEVLQIRFRGSSTNGGGRASYFGFQPLNTNQGVFYMSNTNGGGSLPIQFETTSGDITANDFILSSDVRLKEDIHDLGYGYIKFKRKGSDRVHIGTSAQYVKELYPEVITEDENGFMRVSYIDYLCAEIVRLSKKIDALEDDSA